MMTKRDWVQEQIENLPDYKFVELWNAYCETSCYTERKIHDMGDFNTRFDWYKPAEIADIVACGKFNINDHWFVVNDEDTAVTSDCDAKYLVEDYFEELVDDVTEYLPTYEDFIPEKDYEQFVKNQVFSGDEEAFSFFNDWFHEEYLPTARLSDFNIDDILSEFQETHK